MGIFEIFRPKMRSEPIPTIDPVKVQEAYTRYFEDWTTDCSTPRGYKTLAEVPEIKSAIEKIAEVVSTMTIHLMENRENGDVRIKNELSKMIDVRPNRYMSKQLFISWIVQEMLLEGNAVAVPRTYKGYLQNIEPLTNDKYRFRLLKKGYEIFTNDEKTINADSLLHFRFNPKMDDPYFGQSQEVILVDLIDDLYQANSTVKDFMTSKMMPNVIIKVDALADELKTEEGRNVIENRYIKRSKAGQPWIIPGGLIEVQQVKPLTLNDIAIHDSIKINKQTAASIVGVPAFLLGVGEFDREEYNHFIRNKVSVICKAIESELTEKLLLDPKWYFRFNKKSMINYDLETLGGMYSDLFTKGIVTGNEVRDVLGLSPLSELDELIVLENYIPVNKIGDQKKLGGEEVE